jgi:dihydrofolate reductase
MKMVLVQSADGFLARDEEDDMAWSGREDKAVFRLLTLFDGELLFAGRKTYDLLPALKGRTVMCISRDDLTMDLAARKFPNGVIIGGPSVATYALAKKLVTQFAFIKVPVKLGSGISARGLVALADTTFKEHADLMLGTLDIRLYYGGQFG